MIHFISKIPSSLDDNESMRICSLVKEGIYTQNNICKNKIKERTESEISNFIKTNCSYVFELKKDNEIIGCGLTKESNSKKNFQYLFSVNISKDQRGNGYGTFLARNIVKFFKSKRINLHFDIDKNNVPSLRLIHYGEKDFLNNDLYGLNSYEIRFV